MRLCASKSRGSVASWTRPTASASSRHTMDSACSRTSRCCKDASTSWTASTRTPSTSSTSPEKWANSLYLCVFPSSSVPSRCSLFRPSPSFRRRRKSPPRLASNRKMLSSTSRRLWKPPSISRYSSWRTRLNRLVYVLFIYSRRTYLYNSIEQMRIYIWKSFTFSTCSNC